MDKVGNAIKERRKILKITQRTLAELAGVGINTLTKIERGEGNPTIEVLEKILDTLGLELQIGIKQRNELRSQKLSAEKGIPRSKFLKKYSTHWGWNYKSESNSGMNYELY